MTTSPCEGEGEQAGVGGLAQAMHCSAKPAPSEPSSTTAEWPVEYFIILLIPNLKLGRSKPGTMFATARTKALLCMHAP